MQTREGLASVETCIDRKPVELGDEWIREYKYKLIFYGLSTVPQGTGSEGNNCNLARDYLPCREAFFKKIFLRSVYNAMETHIESGYINI